MIPSDVPYCTLVSGGLDSAVVTTLAARARDGSVASPPLATFTATPTDSSSFDELPFARLVAEESRADLQQVMMGGSDICDVLPAVVRSLGQPNSDPITVSTYRLFSAVGRPGIPSPSPATGATKSSAVTAGLPRC